MYFNDFSRIEAAPPDPILGTMEAFRKDPSPQKVNLGVGVYQDADGKMPILTCVKEASRRILESEDTKTYLPIEGLPGFASATQRLLFGEESSVVKEGRATTLQSIGGSCALRIGIDFLHKFFPGSTLYMSDPTWDNHKLIFEGSGVTLDSYPYYSPETHGVNFAAMKDALAKLPAQSIVLLHACCHNPTGVDLTKEQWSDVQEICAQRKLIPFIDFAYQGFGDGLEEDSYAPRLFAERGTSFVMASSFSKSFALYRERVGACTIVTGSSEEASRVLSQMKRVVRSNYSSPPSFGAQIVTTVLNDKELYNEWIKELTASRDRIKQMRLLFVERLKEVLPGRDFSFIAHQVGMFSYSGLTAETIRALRDRYHIHALESGRICVAAMNPKNLDCICEAIRACV